MSTQRGNSSSSSSRISPASSSTHYNVKNGFCLCHLLCLWSNTAQLGIKLGYYSAQYSEAVQRFVNEKQFYVMLMSSLYLGFGILYLCFFNSWMYDSMIILFYVPLYVCLLWRRQRLLQLLNACVALHAALQQALGELLCVNAQRQYLLCFMLPVQWLLLLIWQTQLYNFMQLMLSLGLACNYDLQLIWVGNYYCWHSCIYLALNAYLKRQLHSLCELELLPKLFRLHLRLQRLHWQLCRYFLLHWLSLLVLLALRLWQIWQAACQQHADHMQQCNFMWLFWLMLTLLALAQQLQQQRQQFECNLLKLQLQLRPAAQLDLSSLLLSANFRAPLPLVARLGKHGNWQFKLLLPTVCGTLKHIALLLLVALFMQLTHNRWRFYSNSYIQYDFDLNVTKTISEFYRWYTYDEVE